MSLCLVQVSDAVCVSVALYFVLSVFVFKHSVSFCLFVSVFAMTVIFVVFDIFVILSNYADQTSLSPSLYLAQLHSSKHLCHLCSLVQTHTLHLSPSLSSCPDTVKTSSSSLSSFYLVQLHGPNGVFHEGRWVLGVVSVQLQAEERSHGQHRQEDSKDLAKVVRHMWHFLVTDICDTS